MARSHYHVVENTPGYLPDHKPECFSNFPSAARYASEIARQLRDDGYNVVGTPQVGYYAERDASDLGRAIEIWPTDEPCDVLDMQFYG